MIVALTDSEGFEPRGAVANQHTESVKEPRGYRLNRVQRLHEMLNVAGFQWQADIPPTAATHLHCEIFRTWIVSCEIGLTGVIVHLSEDESGVSQFWVWDERVQPSCVIVATGNGHGPLHLLRDIECDGDIVQPLVVLEPDIWGHFVSGLLQPFEASLTVAGTICIA